MPEGIEEALIEKDIEQGIVKRMTQTDRNQPNEFRVSELVYCKRKPYLYRKLQRFPKPNGKMLSGTMFHGLIPEITNNIKEFENTEFEKELSIKLESVMGDAYTILGHCDGINDNNLYEFKFTGKVDYPQESLPKQYLMQCNLYSGIAMSNDGIKRNIAIALVHSETLKTRVYRSNFDSDMFDKTLEDIEQIFMAIKHDNFSMLEGPRYSWECAFCDVAKECFELRGKNEEFAKLAKTKDGIKWRRIHSARKKRKIEEDNNKMVYELGREKSQ